MATIKDSFFNGYGMGKAEGSRAPEVLGCEPPYLELVQTDLNIPSVPSFHFIFTSEVRYNDITSSNQELEEGGKAMGFLHTFGIKERTT